MILACLPYIRSIHLLVYIFFEDFEIFYCDCAPSCHILSSLISYKMIFISLFICFENFFYLCAH